MTYFSLSILFEAFEAKTKISRKAYEHRIVLVQFPARPDKATLIEYCKQHLTEEPYQTADGSLDFWQVSKIIDCFELVEEVPENIHTPLEVYSRYFADDFDSTREEILEKYFSDYVYEDQEND